MQSWWAWFRTSVNNQARCEVVGSCAHSNTHIHTQRESKRNNTRKQKATGKLSESPRPTKPLAWSFKCPLSCSFTSSFPLAFCIIWINTVTTVSDREAFFLMAADQMGEEKSSCWKKWHMSACEAYGLSSAEMPASLKGMKLVNWGSCPETLLSWQDET